jgi:AraC family transcriptional regulator
MQLRDQPVAVRRVEPLSADWRSAHCAGGTFDTARRAPTRAVEGVIRTPQHMLLVTLRGGAERLRVSSDCGHRYDGPDRAGLVSFVPAHCERRLAMTRVSSEWASLSLPASLVDGISRAGVSIGTFTNAEDALLSGLVREMASVMQAEGGFEPAYAEAMTTAAAHHLVRRYGVPDEARNGPAGRLTLWQRRRVEAFIEAHLAGDIRIADLAREARLSPGHFHRAWRATTGQSPLAAIHATRVRRALTLLLVENCTVAEVALQVGFLSPGHFARVFRSVTGRSPSEIRRG